MRKNEINGSHFKIKWEKNEKNGKNGTKKKIKLEKNGLKNKNILYKYGS